MESIFFLSSSPWHVAYPESGWENTQWCSLLLQQVLPANTFWFTSGNLSLFSLLNAASLLWTCAGPCALSQSLSSYVYQSCSVWTTLLTWHRSTPPTLTIFPPLLPCRSLNLSGKSLIKTFCPELRAPKSLNTWVNCQLWVFVFTIGFEKKFFVWWLCEVLIYVYSCIVNSNWS